MGLTLREDMAMFADVIQALNANTFDTRLCGAWTIVTHRHGPFTVATIYVDLEAGDLAWIALGATRLGANDKDDPALGIRIALFRAVEDLLLSEES